MARTVLLLLAAIAVASASNSTTTAPAPTTTTTVPLSSPPAPTSTKPAPAPTPRANATHVMYPAASPCILLNFRSIAVGIANTKFTKINGVTADTMATGASMCGADSAKLQILSTYNDGFAMPEDPTEITITMDFERAAPTPTSSAVPTSSKPATSKPGPTTTTTKPGPTTTTTKPGTTTTKPGPTTTKPAPTTTKPAPTTTKPAPTTTKPAPTTTKPAPTTTKPAPTTTKPAPTTTKPAPTTTTKARRSLEIDATEARAWGLVGLSISLKFGDGSTQSTSYSYESIKDSPIYARHGYGLDCQAEQSFSHHNGSMVLSFADMEVQPFNVNGTSIAPAPGDKLDACAASSESSDDHKLAIVIAACIGGLVLLLGIVYLCRSKNQRNSYESLA